MRFIILAAATLFIGCAPFSPKTTCDLSAAGMQTAYLEYDGSCDEVVSAMTDARDMLIEANMLTADDYSKNFAKLDVWVYENHRIPPVQGGYQEPYGRYHDDYIEVERWMRATLHEMEHNIERTMRGMTAEQMAEHTDFGKGMPYKVLDDKYFWHQVRKMPNPSLD